MYKVYFCLKCKWAIGLVITYISSVQILYIFCEIILIKKYKLVIFGIFMQSFTLIVNLVLLYTGFNNFLQCK